VSALPRASESAKEDSEVTASASPPRSLSPFLQPRRPPLYRRLFHNPFSRRAGSLTPPRHMAAAASASSSENASGQGALPHHDRMQVTVLIAMPDPRRPHLDGNGFLDYDEDDLPEMVLGMVEPRYKDAPTPPTSP
jgi:hypothetical protein